MMWKKVAKHLMTWVAIPMQVQIKKKNNCGIRTIVYTLSYFLIPPSVWNILNSEAVNLLRRFNKDDQFIMPKKRKMYQFRMSKSRASLVPLFTDFFSLQIKRKS